MLVNLTAGGRRLGIRGLASEVGSRVIDNQMIAEVSDTSDEWIRSHTGIRRRRLTLPEQPTSDLLVSVGRRAMAQAKVTPDEIDLLVVATITPDNLLPATSAKVHAALGLTEAVSFDLNAGGCANALYALVTSVCLINGSDFRNALVLVGDKMSHLIDWTNRNCNYFFGDGAAAVVLSPVKQGGLRMAVLVTDGTEYETAWVPVGGSDAPLNAESLARGHNKITLKGSRIRDLFLNRLPDEIDELLSATKTSVADLDAVFFHQANLFVLEDLLVRIGLPRDKTITTVEDYGNTGGSSVLTALEHAVSSGRLRPRDTAMLAAMGAGFQWGAVLLDWADADDFHR